MIGSTNERPRRHRPFRLVAAIFATIIMAAGLSAAVLEAATTTASAGTVSFSQCNNRAAGPGGAPLSVTCSISVVNTINLNGSSSSVVYTRSCTLNACTGDTTSSSDVINAVHQCNGSDNVGGSTTICSVNIVNNIAVSGADPPTAATVNQCIGSGGGGGTNMTACIPSSSGGATVTQCNGSGTGGGGMMTCNAFGTVSATFPVTVDQCNGSENGGGSFVTCTTRITTNAVNTDVGTTPVTPVAPVTPAAPGTPGAPGDTTSASPGSPNGTPTAGPGFPGTVGGPGGFPPTGPPRFTG